MQQTTKLLLLTLLQLHKGNSKRSVGINKVSCPKGFHLTIKKSTGEASCVEDMPDCAKHDLSYPGNCLKCLNHAHLVKINTSFEGISHQCKRFYSFWVFFQFVIILVPSFSIIGIFWCRKKERGGYGEDDRKLEMTPLWENRGDGQRGSAPVQPRSRRSQDGDSITKEQLFSEHSLHGMYFNQRFLSLKE